VLAPDAPSINEKRCLTHPGNGRAAFHGAIL
jgi:hypothetical protein